jgi:hypothetical protein
VVGLPGAGRGYLMHGERPVLGADGGPMRIAEPLWDRATHDALVQATAPKRDGHRAPKGLRLLTGRRFANCGARLHVTGRGSNRYAYECTARDTSAWWCIPPGMIRAWRLPAWRSAGRARAARLSNLHSDEVTRPRLLPVRACKVRASHPTFRRLSW